MLLIFTIFGAMALLVIFAACTRSDTANFLRTVPGDVLTDAVRRCLAAGEWGKAKFIANKVAHTFLGRATLDFLTLRERGASADDINKLVHNKKYEADHLCRKSGLAGWQAWICRLCLALPVAWAALAFEAFRNPEAAAVSLGGLLILSVVSLRRRRLRRLTQVQFQLLPLHLATLSDAVKKCRRVPSIGAALAVR